MCKSPLWRAQQDPFLRPVRSQSARKFAALLAWAALCAAATWGCDDAEPHSSAIEDVSATSQDTTPTEDDASPTEDDTAPTEDDSTPTEDDSQTDTDTADACEDVDQDGVCAPADNCPQTPNPDQADTDSDGQGDACDPCPTPDDPDPDADSFCHSADTCPLIPNPDQADTDQDGLGDACDPCPNDPQNDADQDGLCVPEDNCPNTHNTTQLDADQDGLGDACDTCLGHTGGDTDQDGLCDTLDNCPSDHNPDQADTNQNGLGDACDTCPDSADSDRDSVCDVSDRCPGGDDRLDANQDGLPDACDACQWQTRKRWTALYDGMISYRGEGPFHFQVTLYEDGEVAFQYAEMHNIAGPVVGLEIPPTYSAPYTFDTINLPDDTRLLWKPSTAGFDVSISSGSSFVWLDPPPDATPLTLDDDASVSVALPFAFPWANGTQTEINVSSNGYLWFGQPSPQNCCLWQPQPLPTDQTWRGLIAPTWFDLNPTLGGSVVAWSDEEVCAIDCTGAAHGTASRDVCGECTGGSTGRASGFALDCNADCFGTAYLDLCGVCVGGTTGLEPGSADLGCGCFEDPPLPWYADTDQDGQGAGDPTLACRQEVPPGFVLNATDPEPDCATNDSLRCGACGALDCTDTCGGGAAIDPCGICAGGNTGITPSPRDDLDGDGLPDACNGPDLVVDQAYLRNTLSIDYVFVAPGDCYINERCVGGSGNRKVLRFGTMIGNVGNEALHIGPPGQDPEYWEFDACHEHYHYEDYAFYQLFTQAGHELSSLGNKNGWCVLDLTTYGPTPPPGGCNTYSCSNQGISPGCADIYSEALACQWIDITSVPDGTYALRVTTNPRNQVRELRYDNNAAEVTVQIQGNSVIVLQP